MKYRACLILVLGLPIAAVCTLSLPLILSGVIAPDPHPWNWPTVYLIDLVYGMALFSQLIGFVRRRPQNRLWTAAVGGYTVLAFGQAALEGLLHLTGLMAAPISARWPIFFFMIAGFTLGVLMLLFAFRHGQYWTTPSLREH